LKRRTPLLVTTGSEAGGEGTGAADGGGGGGAPRLLSFARGKKENFYNTYLSIAFEPGLGMSFNDSRNSKL